MVGLTARSESQTIRPKARAGGEIPPGTASPATRPSHSVTHGCPRGWPPCGLTPRSSPNLTLSFGSASARTWSPRSASGARLLDSSRCMGDAVPSLHSPSSSLDPRHPPPPGSVLHPTRAREPIPTWKVRERSGRSTGNSPPDRTLPPLGIWRSRGGVRAPHGPGCCEKSEWNTFFRNRCDGREKMRGRIISRARSQGWCQ